MFVSVNAVNICYDSKLPLKQNVNNAILSCIHREFAERVSPKKKNVYPYDECQ